MMSRQHIIFKQTPIPWFLKWLKWKSQIQPLSAESANPPMHPESRCRLSGEKNKYPICLWWGVFMIFHHISWYLIAFHCIHLILEECGPLGAFHTCFKPDISTGAANCHLGAGTLLALLKDLFLSYCLASTLSVPSGCNKTMQNHIKQYKIIWNTAMDNRVQ